MFINYSVCHLRMILLIICVIYHTYFSIETNSMVHVHNTRRSNNIHVNAISSLDKRNFKYHCILNWNSCPKQYRVMSKKLFM